MLQVLSNSAIWPSLTAIPLFFVAALIGLATVPEMAFLAAGGLETSMYIIWLLAGIFYYLVERRKNKSHPLTVVFIAPDYSEFSKIIDINWEGLLNIYTPCNWYDVDYLMSMNPSFLILPPNTSYVQPPDILDFYSMKNPMQIMNFCSRPFLQEVPFESASS